jgi:hypothetical protein
MEGNDYGKQNKKDESSRMHGVFDGPNLRGLHSPKGREDRGDEKPASVERGKRQEVERSKVDGKERRDGKNDSDADLGRHEVDEESSHRYRTSNSFGGFLALGGRFRGDELAEDFEKDFEGERRLVHRFLCRDDDRLPKRVPVLEAFRCPNVGIRDVGSYFPVLRNDRDRNGRSASGKFHLKGFSFI